MVSANDPGAGSCLMADNDAPPWALPVITLGSRLAEFIKRDNILYCYILNMKDQDLVVLEKN